MQQHTFFAVLTRAREHSNFRFKCSLDDIHPTLPHHRANHHHHHLQILCYFTQIITETYPYTTNKLFRRNTKKTVPLIAPLIDIFFLSAQSFSNCKRS